MYYTRTNLKTRIATLISGEISDADQNTLLNRAVSEVIADADLRTMKRKVALTPNLFDQVYQFTCPADLKSRKIIDVQPQMNRGRFDDWRLTDAEEFDRLKSNNREDIVGDPIKIGRFSWSGDNLVAVDEHDYIKKILLSRPVGDFVVAISPFDSLGTWVVAGDASNLRLDSSNYVTGSSSIEFDTIADSGSHLISIVNTTQSVLDITQYISEASIFVWVYLPNAALIATITSLRINIGSDSSNYYYMSATTTNEGTVFFPGWNLVRFDFASKSTTGTPVNASTTYVKLLINATNYLATTGIRFDNLAMRRGAHYDLTYYSKYGWQTAAGVYAQDSTADGDFVNADIDEVAVIELKYSQLAEKHLRNSSAAAECAAEYVAKVKDYQMKNPSEAMLMQTTYSNVFPM